ncbi:LysM peptidoglycan-binding domain-containing protein [Lactobacillus kunkeei]|nr:LysM peptidoglycan-binding domain-containing protein [Apilactobacillus kunkeei]
MAIFHFLILYRSVSVIRYKFHVLFLVIAISFAGLLSIYRNATVDTNANTVVTVKSGDTLENLSDKYNVFMSVLEHANGKYSDDDLLAGDQIVVPDNNNDAKDDKKVSKQHSNKSNKHHSTSKKQNQSQYSAQSAWHKANAEAKAWISFHESTDSYTAQNGRYYGRYQLDSSYLNGDYSPANQERVAEQYVANRYGSWVNAKQHWVANNWY